MGNRSTLVGLLGLGLIGAHFVTSPDGSIIRDSISNADNAPNTADAHTAFAKFGALLLFVIVATVASAGSDNAGAVFVGLFALLWVIWGMNNSSKITKSPLISKGLPGRDKLKSL